ncbi:hypothetical protein B0H19DRAFT_1334535 [Mycena capillaripes]|nr:hypothetical protein B0H19DRAFT_1334535 [Mycena capillaripes]
MERQVNSPRSQGGINYRKSDIQSKSFFNQDKTIFADVIQDLPPLRSGSLESGSGPYARARIWKRAVDYHMEEQTSFAAADSRKTSCNGNIHDRRPSGRHSRDLVKARQRIQAQRDGGPRSVWVNYFGAGGFRASNASENRAAAWIGIAALNCESSIILGRHSPSHAAVSLRQLGTGKQNRHYSRYGYTLKKYTLQGRMKIGSCLSLGSLPDIGGKLVRRHLCYSRRDLGSRWERKFDEEVGRDEQQGIDI